MKNRILAVVICLTVFNFSGVYGQKTKESFLTLKKEVENSNNYALHVKFVAQEGKGQDLVKILLDAASLMKSAEGCYLYVVGISTNNEDEIWVTEIWKSKEHQKNSLKIAGVNELIGKAIPMLKENPEKKQEWNILGGAGLNSLNR